MNKKIAKILYIFILLQPFIDIVTSLMTKFLDTRITLGLLVRGLLFIVCIIYILFISKSKYQKKSKIYLLLLFIFSVCYFLSKPDILSNTSFIVSEIIYMFKYYYSMILLIALFNLFDEIRPNNRVIFKTLQIVLFTYCFSIVLANVTGTAFATYDYGSGNSGWFYAGNDIGIIITLLFPLVYLLINKSNSFKVLLYIIPIIFAIETIGTKTSMLGLLLPTLIFFIYYLIRIRNGKWKQFCMTLIILVIIVISSPNLPVVQNLKNSINVYETRIHKENLDEDYSDTVVEKLVLNDRDYFEKKVKRIYNRANVGEKLFGIGFVNRNSINDKNIEKLIEMDYYDIFYRYGVIGFMVYMLPLFIFIYYVFKLCIKNKFRLNMKQLVLGYMSFVGIGIAQLVGHTFGAPAVIFYLDIAMVLLIYYLEHIQYKIDLDNKKISIIVLHLGVGGIEKYISDICRMIDKKYKIEIVSTYKLGEKPAFEFADDIEIKYLINDFPRRKEFKHALNTKNIIDIFKYGIQLTKILILKYYKNIRYVEELDSKYIITTRDFHNKIVGNNKNRDTIAIATEHNHHNNDSKYIKKIVNSCNNLDYLVLVSRELQKFYAEKLKNTKCVYIPNVVNDIPKFIKNESVSNKLIAVGRLEKEKGFSDLIDIVNIIKDTIFDIQLDIYGNGSLKHSLENKIQKLKLDKNIKLKGNLKHEELMRQYKNYDLYTMSSFTESFGIVLIEAISQSVPCIAFDSAAGAKEILGKYGILVKDRNKEEYAKKVIDLLKNKKGLNEISEKLYKSIDEYSMDNVTKKWNNLLNHAESKNDIK